jgi:glycosylphosphatidylinositol transamidase (GPIT) subunit GPI8
MTKYTIERNGITVNHIVFIGDANKIICRERDILPLTFDNENKAIELASIWENAKVVKIG